MSDGPVEKLGAAPAAPAAPLAGVLVAGWFGVVLVRRRSLCTEQLCDVQRNISLGPTVGIEYHCGVTTRFRARNRPHPSAGRQGLLLAGYPAAAALARHHRGDSRAPRPAGPPQTPRPAGWPAGQPRPRGLQGRNVVERSFNALKQWRGLATRYDKLAVIYRGGAVLAAIVAWLRG
jgi:hypothetical protein